MASLLSDPKQDNDDEQPIAGVSRTNKGSVNGTARSNTLLTSTDPEISDDEDAHSRSSSSSSSEDDSNFSRRIACTNGLKCHKSSCSFKHPKGWKACGDGKDCEEFDCEANHPNNRKKPCRNGGACRRIRTCHFLHPVFHADACPAKAQCSIWNCKKWHPKERPKNCPFGSQCYNTACRFMHPPERRLCPNGVECGEFNCELDHPSGRTARCDQGSTCYNDFCHFLHPTDRNPCEKGSDCKDPNCSHTTDLFESSLRLEDKSNDSKQQDCARTSLKSMEQRQIEREQTPLPILAVKDEFCRRLKAERILVVTAETGSGKSTQLPQYAAEYFGGLIVCTQPRVIAAISLARRVADEYDGTSVGQSVGYRVGHTSVGKGKNRVPGKDILFMTDGTFIQESQIGSLLNEVRVLLIDEAHERTLNTDVTMGIAKQLLETRPTDFYIVISSATIDADKFLKFFQRHDAQPLNVLGRVYPVTVEYIPKEEKEPTEKHALSIIRELYDQYQGNILVFLPGQYEIENAMELFKRQTPDHCIALPLYSALSPEEQDLVLKFDEGASGENRMVVFCTNIAETSLTIKNVRLVIDSGLANEANFDHENRLTVIESVRISRASAEQRKGRAGRTAPGHCVRLYRKDELTRHATEPQILRSSLDLVVLQLIGLRINPKKFPFMDPPDEKHVQTSLELLENFSCIDANHAINQKGELFAKLGIDPRYSAFLFDTYLEHGSILELIATIVAILIAPGSVFSVTGETTEEKENGRDRIARNAQKFDSDLNYLNAIYKDWHKAGVLDSDTRICRTCRKSYNKESSCGPCRAAYSRTHLLNNKILNYIESMSDELMTTMQDSRWQLDPGSVPNANDSAIIGANLFKYFPERHGRLIVPRVQKTDACMTESNIGARIKDMSAFYKRQTTNPYFIAMSMTKVPGGAYVINQLHPFYAPSHTQEEEKTNES